MPDLVPRSGPDAGSGLERELVELGRWLVTGPPRDDLAANVLARVTAPAPVQSPASSSRPTHAQRPARRRLAWAVAAAVALALALVPPVRAAVLELLRLGGVVVREEPRPVPTSTATAPTSTPAPGASGTPVTLATAARAVGAPVAVPSVLGPPDAVVLVHGGRVVELSWGPRAATGGAPTRLDVFVGSLSWGYVKTVWDAVTPTQVSGHDALWFGAPHRIEWVDRSGGTHAEQPRLAGPTLVWVVPSPAGEVTYRLEGPAGLDAALRIAGTAR
ncbi:hypothetical protein [Intrasporangium sp. YIM S08009]|uniref:hypothetical protein n=1 Tax=Intrasporangium zincisolvens TaxID=3080018 RepID=UPI002B05424F|nr:hypothetical protein [Intrasporangium sp. YIM S08009]